MGERKVLCIMLQDYLGKYCDLFEYGGQTYLLVTAFYSKHSEIDFASPEHHQCAINLCEVWNPKEICQRQRTSAH